MQTGLTSKDLGILEDQLGHEAMANHKAAAYAESLQDPQLKALAKLVLPTNEEDGVAWALDRLTAGTLPQG